MGHVREPGAVNPMCGREPDPDEAAVQPREVRQTPHHIVFIPRMGLGFPGIGMLKHHWPPTGLRVL